MTYLVYESFAVASMCNTSIHSSENNVSKSGVVIQYFKVYTQTSVQYLSKSNPEV